MKKKIIVSLLLASTVYTDTITIKWPHAPAWVQSTKKRIRTFLTRTGNEELIQQNIPVNTQENICIENTIGSIDIKSEWKQKKISLTAHKKTANPEESERISITTDMTDPKTIKIKTHCPDDMDHARSDYTLIVPEGIHLHLITRKGAISAHKISGPITATADIGNINLVETIGAISATITTQGYITIENAKGTIQATTKSGSINLASTHKDVTATTYNGKIALSAAALQNAGTIRLSASNGISIALPANLSAHIQAHSERGKVLSEQTIHLDNVALKLTDKAWTHLRRTINGTLGAQTAKQARIVLNTSSGAIKIMENSTN